MLAAALYGAGDIRLEERGMPRCPPGGALVRVSACGLCASDLKMFRAGHKELVLPRVLGHEVAGVVEFLDGKASGLAMGRAVQVAPGVGCGVCEACRAGRHNRCPEVKVLGFSIDGGLAEYLALPAQSLACGAVNPLPAGMEPAVATLAEPLACAINGLHGAGLRRGQRVVIFGAGVVGRLAALAARYLGANRVLSVGIDPARLAGLDNPGLDASSGFDPTAAQDKLGGPAQVALSACPDPRAVCWGAELLEPGGRLVVFSGLREPAGLDLNLVHYRELRLVGAYGCTSSQNRLALRILSEHVASAASLITGRQPLARIQEGMNLAQIKSQIKVVIEP